MLPLHTQKSLDALTWNEIQKLHSSFGLKATANARTRRDYQNRIVAAMPQPVVEPEQTATALTCATCPLARHIDGDRYCCGLTDAVVRGHWEAKTDCYQEIADLEAETTELIASAEIPVVGASTETQQIEAPIAPALATDAIKQPITINLKRPIVLKNRFVPFFFNLPLLEFVVFTQHKEPVWGCLEERSRELARHYKQQHQLTHRAYQEYGGNQPPIIDSWRFQAYLHYVNWQASYSEVVKNADGLDPAHCLEFVIAQKCPFDFEEQGQEYWNYDPETGCAWASDKKEALYSTKVAVQDTIHQIAERLRSSLQTSEGAFPPNPDKPDWLAKMMAEIREYQKTLPEPPKPSKLFTKLCAEMEVGDYFKTDYEVTRRRTQVVAEKQILDGRVRFILNCGISHREIFSEEVWLDLEAPIAEPKQTVATATDDAPPNRGDNGRGRVTSSLPKSAATIASIPHATKPKADDNFMTAFTKESEVDRKFNDLAYLSQLEMEAQLAIERTVIGSEEEAIAYRHLRSIEEDIKYYGQPKPETQPSPAIQQLEIQMTELKKDVFSLFKITPFDSSILPAIDDELEQPVTQTAPEPEGTIHWKTPQYGTIIGKKGASRQFYIVPSGEIHIVISPDFIARETMHPNIRHKQIRDAIELGHAFNPLILKLSPNFERDTEDYNGIGRIMQGCDGRWWAWSQTGVTGHPFFSRELACKYLDRVAGNQTQKQPICAN